MLDKNGRFLSLENVQLKYNVHLNFFQYFQLIAAIPIYLKNKAQETVLINRDILDERDAFYLSDKIVIPLTKLRCKDYYNLFQENTTTEPTSVKRWSRLFANFGHNWKQTFNTIYKITVDNKLREFSYKLLHRILVTNKELKRFKIRNDDICSQCKNPNSPEHTFLECSANIKFYQDVLSWFNISSGTYINFSTEQILFQNYPPPSINNNLRRRLDLLILLIKKVRI